MNYWQELGIEDKITQILRDIADAAPDHHLGHAFLTAYQLAIVFENRHPNDAAQLGFPVGGAGIGQRNSLAQYLAGQLSRNIKSGHLTHIEGAFLSNLHLSDISFQSGTETIHSSLTNTNFELSMFRLRD
jgi:hypothetical protein